MPNSVFITPGGFQNNGTAITVPLPLWLPDGSASAPSLAFSSQASQGIYHHASGATDFAVAGVSGLTLNVSGLALNSTYAYAWSSGAPDTNGSDLFLLRDAANTLALRNGTNPQTYRVYGNATGSKYISVAHDGTNGLITSSSGDTQLQSVSGNVFLGINGTNFWRMLGTGALLAVTDNSYDLGASGANRPRNIYAGTDVFTNNATFLIRAATTLTNGAGAQIATITNGPTAGNPTKWIGVDDNGTTRFIPAW